MTVRFVPRVDFTLLAFGLVVGLVSTASVRGGEAILLGPQRVAPDPSQAERSERSENARLVLDPSAPLSQGASVPTLFMPAASESRPSKRRQNEAEEKKNWMVLDRGELQAAYERESLFGIRESPLEKTENSDARRDHFLSLREERKGNPSGRVTAKSTLENAKYGSDSPRVLLLPSETDEDEANASSDNRDEKAARQDTLAEPGLISQALSLEGVSGSRALERWSAAARETPMTTRRQEREREHEHDPATLRDGAFRMPEAYRFTEPGFASRFEPLGAGGLPPARPNLGLNLNTDSASGKTRPAESTLAPSGNPSLASPKTQRYEPQHNSWRGSLSGMGSLPSSYLQQPEQRMTRPPRGNYDLPENPARRGATLR